MSTDKSPVGPKKWRQNVSWDWLKDEILKVLLDLNIERVSGLTKSHQNTMFCRKTNFQDLRIQKERVGGGGEVSRKMISTGRVVWTPSKK